MSDRAMEFVKLFVREWEATWVDPDELSHEWAELYQEAKAILDGSDRELTALDALMIARGCLDYGGGYRADDEKLEIYRHGIWTVINALEGSFDDRLNRQTQVLLRMGRKMTALEKDASV